MTVVTSLLFVALVAAVIVVQQIQHSRLERRLDALEGPPDKPPDVGLDIVHDRHASGDGTEVRVHEFRPGHQVTYRVRSEEEP